MKGIIIYKSKYGATKKYAEWISEATGFPCVTNLHIFLREKWFPGLFWEINMTRED